MTPIHSESAPAAIGPYAQAVTHGGLVYCSGQIGLVPGTKSLAGDDVATQARQALQNLSAVLAAAGSGLDRVVSATVYLLDMADFAAMNEVYAEAFQGWKPARATVAVSGLPMGCRVEISVIAALRG